MTVAQRRLAAIAALVAIATFPFGVLVANLIQTDHNPLVLPASQLALGSGGWLMTIGFCGLAAGTLLVAFLFGETLGSYRAVPVILLAIAGLLGFIPAAVPTDPAGAAPTAHGMVHNLNGLLTFALYVAAMIASAVTFRRSEFWRPLGRATVGWAAAAVIAFVVLLGAGAVNLFGLGERIALAVFVSWLLLVAGFVARGRTATRSTATSSP